MFRILFIVFLCIHSMHAFAQAPQLIPYQAVARDTFGHPLSNASLLVRFSILSDSLNGPMVWQEEQSVASNPFGLFQAQLGHIESLSLMDWSVGPKYLEVELNLGSGYIVLGTQQLLSVPYALHANSISIDVSEVGDTLWLGDSRFIIVPGISEANSPADLSEHTCGAANVHSEAQSYGTVSDLEGNTYKTITIGTQEWMAENLICSTYRNGELIQSNLTNEQWNTAVQGAWAYYEDDATKQCPFGKLYNAWVVLDERGVCPLGWHVPSDNEWTVLSDYLGGSLLSGAALKSAGTLEMADGWWREPNSEATNASGFSALPAGVRNHSGYYYDLGFYSNWWSSTPSSDDQVWMRYTSYDNTELTRASSVGKLGLSVRCLRD